MTDIRIATLASGSSGNSVYVRAGSTQILIDAGISARAASRAVQELGGDISETRAVFVTHEHIDHVRGLDVMTRRCGITAVHVPEPSARYLNCSCECLITHDGPFKCSVGDMEIEAFGTPHDSAASVGYVVRAEGHTLGVCTDLGFMPQNIAGLLSACDSVVLEANHDIDMLMNGPYPPALKRRIRSSTGHLSNEQCAAAAEILASCGVRRILLAHLSAENNRPELAAAAVSAALARRNLKTEIKVAARFVPTMLVYTPAGE